MAIIPWYVIRFYAQSHVKFTSAVAVWLLVTVVFHEYIQFTLVVWCFVFGIVIAYSFFSVDTSLPNLLFIYTRKKRSTEEEDELALMKTICTICGQKKCPRHRPELNILAFQPWTNLEVRRNVDLALEEFLNIVLKEFVYTWYKDLSMDAEFVDELKTSIRFIAAVLLRRVQKINIPALVTEKIAKAALHHLDAYLQTKRRVSPGSDLQQATLDYLGPNLHCVMQSRRMELEYLRRLTESLFPYILQPQALHSKSMCSLVREIFAASLLQKAIDAIADPDMVNNMLLVFLDDTPPPVSTEPPSPKLPLLMNFAKPLSKNKSCHHLELGEVINQDNSQLLYPFMQFLKGEAAVNVLQFCLACDDFNGRILNPDLSQTELVELHEMAEDLYNNYCGPNALDKIKFDEDVVQKLREIVDGPPECVIKLRTSPPLFKAYEHAYNLLEKTFLPLFHQSDAYYEMLCGDRCVSQVIKPAANVVAPLKPTTGNNHRPQKKKEFGLSNIGSRIKEVFKSTSVEGKLPELENTDDADTVTIASCSSLEDEISDSMIDVALTDLPLHDLSMWRVTIPRIGARPDPDHPKKQNFVFIINVHRIDVLDDGDPRKSSWTVARRYQEFYFFDQKLTEFHGDFHSCQLPPKKSFGTKNHNFMESKKAVLEQYLQKLLAMPQLKGSELLYKFLTTENEMTSSFLPDINLGKIVKLPMKLVKERGQHLDPFLQSFLLSTEASKPRPSKAERRESDASSRSTSSEKFYNNMYENNCNCEATYPPKEQLDDMPVTEIDGVFDMLIYLARYICHIPEWFHHVMITSRMIFKRTVENYLNWYIDQKLFQIMQEHRLVDLIHLLRDILFFDTDPPRSDEQKKNRLEQTLQELKDFIPDLFVSIVGAQNHHEGTKLILDVLQQPKLNKQLSYVLLDIVILELFPELNETYSPDTRLGGGSDSTSFALQTASHVHHK